ncbi:MAG TPA: hypothetical protein DCF63_14800 [Planctomycetaceae bacterium]|nr:hypothetical protein [Planctomycetaceae bacterium]
MKAIQRTASCSRYADSVVHSGVARWVEVASDASLDAAGQIQQIFNQIDQALANWGIGRESLLEVLIFLEHLDDVPVLNAAWDSWIDSQNPPIRACVGAKLQAGLLAEFIIHAAV